MATEAEARLLAEYPGVRTGWIDLAICRQILTKDARFLTPVDGSENSLAAMSYITSGVMQADKTAFVEVMHVYDESKTYLPYNCHKGRLMSSCEAMLASSVSSSRYRLNFVDKAEESTWHHITRAVGELPAHYVCMGFYGLKAQKDDHLPVMGTRLSSNVFHVLNLGKSIGVVCIKAESAEQLPPQRRPSTFVVSVALSKASVKAFLDVLRLSMPGDTIHAVHIQSHHEAHSVDAMDISYASNVSALFGTICGWIRDGSEETFARLSDRTVDFCQITKEGKETVPEAVVRYAEGLNADFVAVGANAADRVARGKPPVGNASLKIVLTTPRNVIVSSWIDVDPRVYDACVRGATAPE